MNEEMEKIAEYERGNRSDGQGEKNPGRNFLDDPRRSGPAPDADRKERSRRHVRNWGGVDFERVKTGGPERDKEWQGRRSGGPMGPVDVMSMTGRERSEYERWKQEREQIDQDRLSRHRNATGQWRREWDVQKTESTFKEAAAAMQEQGETDSRREENKRPPKQPTFGDFLGQGKGREAGRGRGRGRDRNYSMHDNRWEEEVKKREAEGKREAGSPRNKAQHSKDEAQEKVGQGREEVPYQEADEDQWEDASDGEEEEGESEEEKEEEKEKKLPQKQNKKQPSLPPTSNPPRPSPFSAPQPRGDEGRRGGGNHPKLQLPPKQTTPEPPTHEPSKPLSPFSPAEGYDPVMDWGEEMEQQSPRSSLGEPPLGQPALANPKPTSPKSGPSCAKLVLGEEPEVGAETQNEADPGEQEKGRETQSPARAEFSSEEKPNSPAEPEPAAQSQVESENVSGDLETGGVSASMPEREEEGSAVESKLDTQGTSDETGERENESGCSETALASKSKEPTESEPSLEPPMDTPPPSEADPPSQESTPQPDRDLEPATESQVATG